MSSKNRANSKTLQQQQQQQIQQQLQLQQQLQQQQTIVIQKQLSTTNGTILRPFSSIKQNFMFFIIKIKFYFFFLKSLINALEDSKMILRVFVMQKI